MEEQKAPKPMSACSHAEGAGRATDQEGIWSDPEAVLRPTEGERLKAMICEFEEERYPQMMALGWTKLALERPTPEPDRSEEIAGELANGDGAFRGRQRYSHGRGASYGFRNTLASHPNTQARRRWMPSKNISA